MLTCTWIMHMGQGLWLGKRTWGGTTISAVRIGSKGKGTGWEGIGSGRVATWIPRWVDSEKT